MATVRIVCERPSDACDPIGTAFPQSIRVAGTNFPVEALAFDDGTNSVDEACVFKFKALSYGSGNITFTITWCADTATTGTVYWGGAVLCITPESDTTNVTTDSFSTENTNAGDAHLGTTARRLHNTTVNLANLDSIAANDWVWLRIRRVTSNAGDTLAGDAWLIGFELSYSDT